jgi:hypothetical protein
MKSDPPIRRPIAARLRRVTDEQGISPPDAASVPALGSHPPLTPADALALQRTIGNQATTRLIAVGRDAERGAGRDPARLLRMAAYAAPDPPLAADAERAALKAHVTTTPGPHGTFKDEGVKFHNLLFFYDRTGDPQFGPDLRRLVVDVNKADVGNQAIIDQIADLAVRAAPWGGADGLIGLVTTRYKALVGYIDKDEEVKRSKQYLNPSNRVEHFLKYRAEITKIAYAGAGDIVARAGAFLAWQKENKDTYYEFSLDDAIAGVTPKDEEAQQGWTNRFFFPKARNKLGLPQGTGQQLYTADVHYDGTYDWHISVAFRIVESGKQLVAIDRIHFSFKHRAHGGDKSVWFTVSGLKLALGSPHGGSPSATMITFAQGKVKTWATDYTGFEVQW